MGYSRFPLFGTDRGRAGLKVLSLVPRVKVGIWFEQLVSTWEPGRGGYLTELPRTNLPNVISGRLDEAFVKASEAFLEEYAELLFDSELRYFMFFCDIQNRLVCMAADRQRACSNAE